MRADVILCLSGGLDSSVLLFELKSRGLSIKALTFDYGQKHSKEITAAHAIAKAGEVPCETVMLKEIARFFSAGALTDPERAIPLGHYEEASMKATIVPNRNMIFLSLAAGHAIAEGAKAVSFAAHAGDHAIYPDCRPAFTAAIKGLLRIVDWNPIELLSPFVSLTKAEICRRGAELNVPFELTWSCYQGMELHCGKCGTCTERREAFTLAGVADPTRYCKV